MAVPVQLGVVFTPVEIATMKTAAQSITSMVRSKIMFNMSNEERESLSKVGDERAPFVLKSIGDYGVTYPNLNGQAYAHPMAAIDMSTFGDMHEVLTVLAEATEVVTELQMVAGHFCFKFMRDQYDNAAKYRSENVAGAQVVYDGLKDCFEGQGQQQNPTPSNP